MRSAVAYRPIIGFFAHSVTHSAFMLSRSSPWSFDIVRFLWRVLVQSFSCTLCVSWLSASKVTFKSPIFILKALI